MQKDIFNLNGKVCVITGGAGLLGSAFVEACAFYEAEVVILDVDEKSSKNLVRKIKKEFNKDIYFFRCDINNEKRATQVLKLIESKFGKVDALVNNAYIRNKNYGRKFEDVTYKDFCENVNLNLGGYFLMSRVFSNQMKRQGFGNIVNIGSIYGFTAPKFEIYEGTKMTMPVEYAVIKAGVINLTRYLASYLGIYNIRVNSISPGGVFDNQPKEFVKKYTNFVKLNRYPRDESRGFFAQNKRMANTGDLTGVLVFLLSDASCYITGENLIVDGGWTL